jgi:hypothetical protein
MASATERKRVSRRRKKLGKMVCQVEVSSQEIDFLRRRGYGPRQGDQVSVSEAVTALLGDLVLEATA